MLAVGTYINLIVLSSTRELIYLSRIAICLVFWCSSGFFAMEREPVYSPYNGMLFFRGCPISSEIMIHVNSLAASEAATYSASVVEIATIFCTFDTYTVCLREVRSHVEVSFTEFIFEP